MLTASEVIDILLGPVVMISANGLLCLAFYNRLSNVISRCRTINKERVDLAAVRAELGAEPGQLPRARQIEQRTAVLEAVGAQLLRRARWVRRVLYSLLLAILCLLACSLTLGLATVWPQLSLAALAFFVCGTLMMMIGGAMAIQELRLAIGPLSFETARSGSLPAEDVATSTALPALRKRIPVAAAVLKQMDGDHFHRQGADESYLAHTQALDAGLDNLRKLAEQLPR